jgi:hypothetical protein
MRRKEKEGPKKGKEKRNSTMDLRRNNKLI